MLRLLATLPLCLAGHLALACKCLPATFAEESRSSQVFIGRPLRKAETPAGKARYLFAVARAFKGQLADTITIETGLGGPDCGFQFELGEPYVVFASAGRTSRCGRTARLAETADIGKLLYTFRRSFADSLGRDASPLLNASEARYFDLELRQQRGAFSFQGQRVAFFEGNSTSRTDKQQYLRRWAGQDMGHQLLVLTPAEKQQAGGYDAVIVFWNKIAVSPAHRRRLVRRLGRYPA